jgi:hypothetical protein
MRVSRGSICFTFLWLLMLCAAAVPALAEKSCDEPVTLRSEDLVAISGWPSPTELDACHSGMSCGPEYGSCAGWSNYYACGDPFCGEHQQCDFCSELPCGFGPAMIQRVERYRVCFNSLAEPCTEYSWSSYNAGCGCW